MADLAKKAKSLWEDTKKKVKRPTSRSEMGVYSNLATQKRTIARRAESKPSSTKTRSNKKPAGKKLRPLPEDPWKRFLAHFRWERIRAYWFSKAGLKRIGKIFAALLLSARCLSITRIKLKKLNSAIFLFLILLTPTMIVTVSYFGKIKAIRITV